MDRTWQSPGPFLTDNQESARLALIGATGKAGNTEEGWQLAVAVLQPEGVPVLNGDCQYAQLDEERRADPD